MHLGTTTCKTHLKKKSTGHAHNLTKMKKQNGFNNNQVRTSISITTCFELKKAEVLNFLSQSKRNYLNTNEIMVSQTASNTIKKKKNALRTCITNAFSGTVNEPKNKNK